MEHETTMASTTAVDPLLTKDQVRAITGLPVSSLYELVARGDFPAPIALSAKRRAWKQSEVVGWIDSRPRVTGDAP